MNVWIAHVVTESCDHYTWPYTYEPTREEVIQRLWESEGEIEDLEWYEDTTSVKIECQEVTAR